MPTIYWNDPDYVINVNGSYLLAGMTRFNDTYYGYTGNTPIDFVIISGGYDQIYTYGGDDLISSRNGNSPTFADGALIYAGTGDDEFTIHLDNITAYGEAGKDKFVIEDSYNSGPNPFGSFFYGGTDKDSFKIGGSSSNPWSFGNIGTNIFAYGEDGDDIFISENNSSTYTAYMNGGDGDDIFTLRGSGRHEVVGGDGNDSVGSALYLNNPFDSPSLDVHIDLGAGDDYVSWQDAIKDDLLLNPVVLEPIKTGDGDDNFLSYSSINTPADYLDGYTLPNLTFHGGADNDFYVISFIEGKEFHHTIYDSSGSEDRLYLRMHQSQPDQLHSVDKVGADLLLTYRDNTHTESTITIENYYGDLCLEHDNPSIEFIYIGNDIWDYSGNPELQPTFRDRLNQNLDDNVTMLTPFSNQILGTDGNDTIVGTAEEDFIHGCDGDDKLYGNESADLIYGGNGVDRLYGREGNDELYGQADNDFLFGDEGNDQLYGGAGSDDLHSGEGDDFAQGGSGQDDLFGNAGNDTLDGGADNDRIYGGEDDDHLIGGHGNDFLYGDSNGPTIVGSGDDNLHGGEGVDRLYGQGGNDILNGGADSDFLWGGQGSDTFAFDELFSGFDKVNDFSATDDFLDISDVLDQTDWDGSINTLNDYVTVTQAGTSFTYIGVDQDGLGTAQNNSNLIRISQNLQWNDALDIYNDGNLLIA